MSCDGVVLRLMRALVVIVLVVVMAVPAGAGVPSGAEATTPLTDLIEEVELEIAVHAAAAHPADTPVPLPEFALTARSQVRMLRADYFIGSIRARAHDRLHSELDGVALEVLHLVGPDDDEPSVIAALEGAGATSREIWRSSEFLFEWLRLQHLIGELRLAVAPGLPERVCPVDGLTWFRDEWQFPRPGGRIHKGVDMHAELGQALVAVEDGVVIQANWHWQGGRQVWFRGDSTGDIYYYAHLEYWPPWLWTGTRLEAGDFIGLAGASGNADTPHLHLGWMPGSSAVDLDNLQNAYPLVYELCR